jgi:CheY-like chemotaxis protein
VDVLIVEDEAIIAMAYSLRLRKMGDMTIEHAFDADGAMAAVAKSLPKVILMDIKLRGPVDGIQVAEAIRSRHDIPIIFITAYADDETLGRARRTQPAGIFNKGDMWELPKIVQKYVNA